MKVAEPSTDGTGSRMAIGMDHGSMVMNMTRMNMVGLAGNLSSRAGRPVFDKTGLTGLYDFTLKYAPEQNMSGAVPGDSASGSAVVTPADPVGPTLLAALEDQLGLKLVPSRGSMYILVIDHIEKPGAN
jgi:uncharacterized protein (TIGR03435 family)